MSTPSTEGKAVVTEDVGGGPAWDTDVEWDGLSSEALTALLYDRDETNRYITRLESAAAVLRGQKRYLDRFFDAVNELAPDVCDEAMNLADKRKPPEVPR